VLNIRPATAADHEAIWDIFHEVVVPGDTYTFDPQISREEAFAYWFRPDTHTYVAESVGEAVSFPGTATPKASASRQPFPTVARKNRTILGTYVLRPNRPGLGAHVSNASFMVAPAARGQGIGRAMGEHCLEEARRLGFCAMQFNFVVSTNDPAMRLWKTLGFEIVGTLPGAFRHSQKGYVDAYVMFRNL
jgi:L-amino acid N-acyltransferase YncA